MAYSGMLTVSRSTITNNRVDTEGGGGISAEGLYRGAVSLQISDSTIADNISFGGAGGIEATNGGGFLLSSSTITGNFGSSSTGATTGGIFFDIIGSIVSNGHNIFGQQTVSGSLAGDRLDGSNTKPAKF